MKKIILLILIMFAGAESITLMSADLNNNNNNNSSNKIYNSLPKDVWNIVAINLINIKRIENAKTLKQLKVAYRDLFNFSFVSKMHYEIIRNLLNNFKLKINDKEIPLKQYYVQRKIKLILQEKNQLVEKKLLSNSNISYDWFDHINAKDDSGCTLLMYFCSYQDFDFDLKLVELLIKNGVDVNAKDNKGNTPLICAAHRNNYDVVDLLLKNCANINVNDKNNKGDTALICAAHKNNYDVVDLLLNNCPNINVNDKNNDGETALICAVNRNNYELVNLLIQKGANVNYQDKIGSTVLMNTNLKEIIELLIQNGANVNAKDKQGETRLMYACRIGNLNLVELLIQKRADVNIKNNKGQTALDIARKKNYFKIVKLLEIQIQT